MTLWPILFTGWVRLRRNEREAALQALELRIDDLEQRVVIARSADEDDAQELFDSDLKNAWAAYLRLGGNR